LRWEWYGARSLLWLLGPVLVCCATCERARSPDPAALRSPRATIELLIAARDTGSYHTLNELIVSERVHEVVKTLMAVDEFLHANQSLCDYVRETFALGLSQSIDQSAWGAQLEIFSRYVELVDQHIEGDTATITFTIDGRVPVHRAHLVRVEGAWRYDPGSGYDPRLPAAFERMAQGLRRVLDDLKEGRLSVDAIRADPRQLVEEVRVRLQPGIKMLPPAATQPSDD
jgi:hypothetical protein